MTDGSTQAPRYITQREPPPKRKSHCVGGIEHNLSECAIMVAFGIYLLDQGSIDVRLHPDGDPCCRKRHKLASGVDVPNWILSGIRKGIQPSRQSNRICFQIPPQGWGVVPKPVVMPAGLCVEFLSRETQGLADQARLNLRGAKRFS